MKTSTNRQDLTLLCRRYTGVIRSGECGGRAAPLAAKGREPDIDSVQTRRRPTGAAVVPALRKNRSVAIKDRVQVSWNIHPSFKNRSRVVITSVWSTPSLSFYRLFFWRSLSTDIPKTQQFIKTKILWNPLVAYSRY